MYIRCAFFREVAQQCGSNSYVWNIWRDVTSCGECSVWVCHRCFVLWLLIVAVGDFRGAKMSRRPCLHGAGASLSPQLLQPQPCDIQRGSGQLLCLPNKWGSPVWLSWHTFKPQRLLNKYWFIVVKDTVINDHEGGFRCVSAPSCPCVFAGKSYSTGDVWTTKCQTW